MDVDDTGQEPSNFLPVQDELDVQGLPFEGRLPDALRGTLFRNNLNPRFSLPDAHCHGDGMVLEEAHPPLAICPTTLRTLGVARQACGSTAPLTAHPKIDPRTVKLLFLGYSGHDPFSTGIRCGSIDRDGGLVRQTGFEAPYSSMIHDFATTPNFIVIPVLRRGGPASVRDPAPGASLALQPRGGTGRDIAWIEAPARYAFHGNWVSQDRLGKGASA